MIDETTMPETEADDVTETVVTESAAAQTATPAAAATEVTIVLRRDLRIAGVMEPKGTVLGSVTLAPGISLNVLTDAYRNGHAQAK